MSFLLNPYITKPVLTSLCGTASEGGTVTLTVPAGNYIRSIDFVSYGTPNGTCGAYTIGGCHATKDLSSYIGSTSLSVDANNSVFGDPCGGTAKRLYIQISYST